jgi:hypothetical protein
VSKDLSVSLIKKKRLTGLLVKNRPKISTNPSLTVIEHDDREGIGNHPATHTEATHTTKTRNIVKIAQRHRRHFACHLFGVGQLS